MKTIFDGKSQVIIMNGKMLTTDMKHEMYTVDDLITQMRSEGYMDLSEVRLAILETNGRLSVFGYDKYEKVTLPVVVSGEIVYDNLKLLNMSEKDLLKMIFERHLVLLDIYYASSDGINFFYILGKKCNKKRKR